MGNESTENNSQETITVSTEDPQRIKELEAKLEAKEQEVKDIKEKTITAIKKIKEENKPEIKTNLTANIIKQNTFQHKFRNGYADGKVAEEKKKILAERRQAKAGIK